MKREFKLISYLEVNNELPRDNESVGLTLMKLDVRRRNTLWKLDRLYQRVFDIAFFSFLVNSIISAEVIFLEHGESGKTRSVFATNTIFLSMKFVNIYYVKKSKKNVFYSAYLSKKIQFNDVDPDKIEEIVQLEDVGGNTVNVI